jgi:hypothetical protein
VKSSEVRGSVQMFSNIACVAVGIGCGRGDVSGEEAWSLGCLAA